MSTALFAVVGRVSNNGFGNPCGAFCVTLEVSLDEVLAVPVPDTLTGSGAVAFTGSLLGALFGSLLFG